jgi:general secretion pathway protein G
MIVVVAIIATLAALVGPSILRNVGDSKVSAARSQIELYALALGTYRLDSDVYPSTDQGLEALRSRPTSGDAPRNWRGPYLSKQVAMDPWGRPYVYVSPGLVNATSFDLYSLGRDGKVGGENEDADITSWGGSVEGGHP